MSETHIKIENIEFKQDGQQIAGVIYRVPGEGRPGLVILRGGLNIPNKESDNPIWQQAIADQGINSLSLDFRGTGDSEGILEATSLETRADDARTAASTLKNQSSTGDIYLAGVSMGAPIVLRIASEVGAKGVILISPAAYAADAKDKNFGPDFTKVLRRERSWQGSPDFEALREFGGQILLAYATGDRIIPEEILRTYAEIVTSKQGTIYAFEDVSHSFIRQEDPTSLDARRKVYDAIVELTRNV